MWKCLNTETHLKDTPIMFVDNYGLAHCIWKNNGFNYAKFNGVDWEYANDTKILPIYERSLVPENGLITHNDSPYFLYLLGSGRGTYWGGNNDVYLGYLEEDWVLPETSIIKGNVFSTSLVSYSGDVYIGVLYHYVNRYLISVYIYKNGVFTHLNHCQINDIKENNSLLMKMVEEKIYCFWTNNDGTNYWIEHVEYDVDNNVFIYTPSKKVLFSNNNIPIAGIDFIKS